MTFVSLVFTFLSTPFLSLLRLAVLLVFRQIVFTLLSHFLHRRRVSVNVNVTDLSACQVL